MKNILKYKEEIPLINIEKEFNRYEVKKTEECFFSHEAGFDSFMTGYVFFKILALQSKIELRNYFILFFSFRFRFFSYE